MKSSSLSLSRLAAADLIRLANSSDLGTVLTQAALYRHFALAGFRVAAKGDAKKVNLFAYLAWLFDRRAELVEAAREEAEKAAAAADARTLEEVRRDDILAATRLKRLRIAENEGRMISRDLAVDLLAELAQAYLSAAEENMETPTNGQTTDAKAALAKDYAALLGRLPGLLAKLDAAHPVEGPA